MFGMFGGFGGPPGGRFEASYRCYPVSFIDKPEAERGDKIFLPPSALDRLAQLHIDYPMLFRVENRRDGRTTHCGVLEFIADEGMVYLPYWMMQNLVLQEGDIIKLSSATLPKGKYVKLQPHTTDFTNISNPRAVLETTLRNFSCLTVGDTICVHYNNKKYYIDIIEAKPQQAISVIETDCEVDFAQPLDYVEPLQQQPPQQTQPVPKDDERLPHAAAAQPPQDEQPKFLAFSGSGRRLDGKAAAPSIPVAIPLPGSGPSTSSTTANSSAAGNDSTTGSAPKKAGKLMFKDRLSAKFDQKKQPGVPATNSAPKQEKKEPEDKFKPFQGTSFKLK